MNEEKVTTKILKIVIAEDHELSRVGLSMSLQKKSPFEVVGEAESGDKAVSLANDLNPNVVLMDIGMPVMDGIEATHKIKQHNSNIKVIMLTSHSEGEEVYASLAAGADAYCLKDIKVERLIQVIEMVFEGAVWLDPAIAQTVLKTLPLNLPNHIKTSNSKLQYNLELTQRELEVLEKIVEGKSNKEIASELFITIHTVKAHVCNIINKLAVDDRTQAAVKALRDGLVNK
ncbi:MAG: response regulator transcription factor [Candidatus Caenarcaniphilales bacterium]|nr:response regulator transcription factor [Candidatus Caenarcaniphilales bacterium]